MDKEQARVCIEAVGSPGTQHANLNSAYNAFKQEAEQQGRKWLTIAQAMERGLYAD